MRSRTLIQLVCAHAEGEIGKVVVGGLLDLPGESALDKLLWLRREGEELRRFLTFEPRGQPQASVNLVLPSRVPEAHGVFLVLQPDGVHAMSGSNAICTTTVLLETGMVAMREPESEVVLDTAAGLVRARARCCGGRCESVELAMPASFVDAEGVELDVDGIGRVVIDVAFGGVFYALLDPERVGLSIAPERARELVDVGMRVLAEAKRRLTPRHPERPELAGLAYLMFAGWDRDGPVNATIMPPGRIDRSPCGTGSSARLALMFQRGQVREGETVVFRSIIQSRFVARIAGTLEVGGRPAVRPVLSGRAWIYGREEILCDPEDPFRGGHLLSDVWGPGIGER